MIAPFIPLIWQETLVKCLQQELTSISPYQEWCSEWQRAHDKRMVEDPEYAKEQEAFDQWWIEQGENCS